MPSQQVYEQRIREALDEAYGIASIVVADPTAYVGDKIEQWGKTYSNAPLDRTADKGGFFFRAASEVRDDLAQQWPNATFPPLPTSFELGKPLATGNEAHADAVMKKIQALRDSKSRLRITASYETLERAKQTGNDVIAAAVLDSEFLRTLEQMNTLFNTMQRKMTQGPRPVREPGPGEVKRETPFGTSVVPEDHLLLGSLKVGEFRALLAEILGK